MSVAIALIASHSDAVTFLKPENEAQQTLVFLELTRFYFILFQFEMLHPSITSDGMVHIQLESPKHASKPFGFTKHQCPAEV